MSVKNNFKSRHQYSFPCPWRTVAEEGVLAVGGELTAELLIEAYSLGIFPWPHEDYPLLWFCPEERGILDFDELHLSRSFKKWLQKNKDTYHLVVNFDGNFKSDFGPTIKSNYNSNSSYSVNEGHDVARHSRSVNLSDSFYFAKNRFAKISSVKNFEIVMNLCEKVKRKGQAGSWITEDMKKSYAELFLLGKTLAVECWKGDQLVAGLYGVLSNNYFSAESMFHLEDNTSKLVFIAAASYLKNQGYKWMDIQMVTPITESFGGKYISKKEFLKRIDCPKY